VCMKTAVTEKAIVIPILRDWDIRYRDGKKSSIGY